MKITVLGGTGATGRQLIDQALAVGHSVTALVRDPARLDRQHPSLTVRTGDATNVADLTEALADADALLSALGAGRSRSSDIASRAARAIVEAAPAAGVSRVVVMSAFGVGGTLDLAGRLQRTIINAVMKSVFADKDVADDLLRASGLDWTLVYPVTLSNGPATGSVAASETPVVTLKSKISRADVAAFMLTEAASPSWLGRTVIIQGQ